MTPADQPPDFWEPRPCMREPIAAIFEAARLLDEATTAHLAGDFAKAAACLQTANMPEVRAWTESLWGRRKDNPDQHLYHRTRKIPGAPPRLPKAERLPVRMPTDTEKAAILQHYGHNCAFCGIPVIRKEVRKRFMALYPQAVTWGDNPSQHAAFQCMSLQFDHVLPHSRGGDNSFSNIVIACDPCNCGRWFRTLEELGLSDPRDRPPVKTSWDGLERILVSGKSMS